MPCTDCNECWAGASTSASAAASAVVTRKVLDSKGLHALKYVHFCLRRWRLATDSATAANISKMERGKIANENCNNEQKQTVERQIKPVRLSSFNSTSHVTATI